MTSKITSVNGHAGIDTVTLAKMGAFGGGGSVPLANWKVMKKFSSHDSAHVFVELYNDPLTFRWHKNPSNKDKIRLHLFNSTSKLDNFQGASAAVVRPGPNFQPEYLYKVSLFSGYAYNGDWVLVLTMGVYPDLHRFGFGDHARSVLIEYADPTKEKEPIPEEEGYYDVSSFYKQHG
jgi:hypothetical protein